MSNARAILWLLVGSIAAGVAYFVVGVYAPEARVQADGRLAAVPDSTFCIFAAEIKPNTLRIRGIAISLIQTFLFFGLQ